VPLELLLRGVDHTIPVLLAPCPAKDR
jgi:hypothetical protein